jgi:hypothetical protein
MSFIILLFLPGLLASDCSRLHPDSRCVCGTSAECRGPSCQTMVSVWGLAHAGTTARPVAASELHARETVVSFYRASCDSCQCVPSNVMRAVKATPPVVETDGLALLDVYEDKLLRYPVCRVYGPHRVQNTWQLPGHFRALHAQLELCGLAGITYDQQPINETVTMAEEAGFFAEEHDEFKKPFFDLFGALKTGARAHFPHFATDLL